MVVDIRPVTVTAEQLKYWDSNPVMKEWKEIQIASGTTPDIDEAVINLRFLLAFSVGCRKMELDETADTYSKAAELYIRFLKDLGYQSSLSMGRRTKTTMSGSLDNIIRKATFGIVRDEDCY
jgi:hypothetical protein